MDKEVEHIWHQTSTQIDYLLDIGTSGILNMTEGMEKSNATNKSGNWKIWCTFLTHKVLKNIFWTESHKY